MPRLAALSALFLMMSLAFAATALAESVPYPIVDTGQQVCYGTRGKIACGPGTNAGQDAQYQGNQPRYINNGDGTVSDLVTGLMWVKARGERMGWEAAMREAADCRVGGYDDWRAPSIKELYSLIDFRGSAQRSAASSIPYLDTRYFDFAFGNASRGQRIIDCQDWSATRYVATTMGGSPTAFGVNFADGRIKGYPSMSHRTLGRYIRYVRGNPRYGRNDYRADTATITDRATGLVWQRGDSGRGLDWPSALNYCERLELGGHDDWRLPNAKELQSIVDYTRSPATTGTAAIDPVFSVSDIESYYWTGTTHLDGPSAGSQAVYIAFGRAMGQMAMPGSNQKQIMDVHGAGAQRSDPKSGRQPANRGPQGDDVRVKNYVRCVRGGQVTLALTASGSARPPWAGRTENVENGADTTTSQNQRGGMGRGMGMNSGMGRGMNQGGMGQGTNQYGQRPEMQPGMGQGQYGQPPQMPQGMGQSGMQQGGMQQGGMQQGQGRGFGPPPEAREACQGRNQNEACSFESPHGTITGLCMAPRGEMICVPEHGRGGPGGMRPGSPPQQ